MQELANTSVPESEVWHARTEPLTRRNYFHNVETGKTQRLLPAILGQARARRRAAQRLAIEGGGDEECYEHRRQRLAFQGVNEWSFSWSDAECCNIFTNAVSCEICTTMPDDLNTFGRLRSLTDLHVDHNRLRDLPDGIGQLKSLKKLVARENYIRVLPNSLGNLAKLEILDLGDNELDELPESTSALSSLELLVIQSNRFEKLPAFLGRLPALKMLRVGHNSLKTLPYEIGFADNLIQLQIYDNPLDEPSWYDSDLPKLKWYCRQKYWSLKNGPLPIVESTRVSICDEVFEPAPAHKMRVEKAIEDARETGILELQLQGVHEIPGACVERGKTRDDDEWFHPKLEGLQTLKMSMNAFSTGAPLFTKSLNKLRVLWLKDCCLTHIDDNIDNLQALRELVIESNAIYYLPSTFGRLRRLKKLNAAKNRLQWLPEGIFAKSLEYLDLSMNRLERVECVASLENLVDLSVACNHLFTLPLLHLPKLTRLNLDSNELRDLPPGLGDLPLVSLRVGHNRLERFAEDGVGPTLEYLGLANNNLLELPNSLPSRATSLRTLQVEHNPLRSPPAELASQGMAILKNYCDLRDTRMKSFEKMLTEYDFEFDAAHFSPQAFNVLVAGARTTGFLTKQDLEAFDASVDEYLNGPYYKFSATDVDIVEKIDAIRQERQHIFYNSMLQALIDTLRTQCEESVQKTRRLFGCGVLIETEKPWGRRGENVGVYALSLDALVHKTPKRQFVKEERTALFDLVKRRLPWSSFNTLETLKDAITKYEGPYGPVAHLDKVEFERCECVDERGRSKGHRKCVLPSLLVVKTIYTVGEAQRRVQEDDAIRSAWNTCWDEIDAALDTKLGKLMAQKEMFRREKNQGTRAKKLKAALADKRRQVRRASEFHQAALNRKKSYQQGGAFHFHRLESDSEAQRLVADAVRELDERTRELKETANELADVKMLAKAKKEVQLRNVAIDLKRKYCVLAYETIVDENRRRAFAHDWRRPWDGEDGIDFKKWSNAHSTALRSESSNLSTVPRWVSNLLNTRRTAGETDDDDDNPDKTFDYDWNGTDDMTQFFSNSRYSAFQEEQYALP